MESRKVASNSIFLLSAKGVRLLISMVLAVVLARYLGASNFGSWMAASSLCALMQVMIALGIDKIAIRECSIKLDQNPSYLGNALTLKLLLSLLGAGVLIALVRFLHYPPLMTQLVFIALGVHVFSTLGDTFVIPFRSWEKMQYEAAVNVAKDLFLMFLIFLGLFLSLDVVGIAYIYLAAAVFYFLFSGVVAKTKFFPPRLGFDRKLALHLVTAGLPLGAAIFFNSHHDMIKIAIQRVLDAEAAGYYSVAAFTYQAWERTVLLSLMAALFPVISRLHASDRQTLGQAYRRMSKYLYIASLPWAVVCLLLPGKIVLLLFGAAYAPAAPVVMILGPASILMFQNYLLYNAMVAARKEGLFALIMGGGAVLILLLTLILIRTPLGISGGAVALGAGQLFIWALFIYSLRSDYRVYPRRRDWLFPSLAGAFAAAEIWWIRGLELPFGVIVVSGCLTYLLGLIALGSFNASDRLFFKKIVFGKSNAS